MTTRATLIAAVCALLAATAVAVGQDEATEKAIQKYRDMLKADPWSNPALLDADRGEALWKSPRGPKNVSLEKCDLGKGPGKVDGAFAELPRYFADAGRVMDLETRILWCMETLQGFKRADLVKRPHPGGGQPVKELGAMATYVASKSADMKFAAKLDQPQETRDGGARRNPVLPPLRAVRFRLRDLPRRPRACASACRGCRSSSSPEEARKVVGEWPAYRVSTTHVMTMQHRMFDCYWQMRMPELELGSEASVALITYPDQTGARRRDRRARPQALSRESIMEDHRHCRSLDRSAPRPPLAQQKPAIDPARADAVIKSAFPNAPADWQSRLVPDETMRECSAHHNNPPRPVAEAIQQREKVTIAYPADGKLMGEWQKGERIAQSGYGLRFTDYPPRGPNGGNCYACHQMTKAEVSYGTLGPSLLELRQAPQFRRGRDQGGLREDLQLAGDHPVLEHAAVRHQQGAHDRADQGRGGAADEPGQSGQQVAPRQRTAGGEDLALARM